MSKIVLIRPGRTDYDEQSRLMGALEMPMNDAGVGQVEDIVRHLQQEGIRPEAIYTSPSDPACSTARAIAEALKGVKVKELEELRNVDQGLWQGLPEADVRKRYPQFFRNGRERPQTICPPEGETLVDACGRLHKVLNKAIKKYHVLAIVAADPIASVIRCTLQERGLTVASCLSGEHDRPAVEFFESDSFESSLFVNWECGSESSQVAAQSGVRSANAE
jgi:broad specificity phosphatase PhoE